MYTYIQERGGKVVLDQVAKPQTEWKSPLDAIEESLKHERYITGWINNLMNVAMEEKDHASMSFLTWFVDEQVEEEANVGDVLCKLKLIGTEGNALFMIDAEMAKRVFVPPAATR